MTHYTGTGASARTAGFGCSGRVTVSRRLRVAGVVATLLVVQITCLAAIGRREPEPDQATIRYRLVAENNYPVNPNSALVEWQEDYIRSVLGVDVKFEFLYFERINERELLTLALMSGNVPDIFQGYPDPQFRDFIAQGVLRPFDVLRLQEAAPTYYGTLTKYGGESIWTYGEGPDGRQYGVPGISYDGQFHYVPVIRDDWLQNVGIDRFPVTLEEFERAFYAFRYDDPNGSGEMDTYALSDKGMAAIFGAFGGLPPLVRNRINWTLVDGRIDPAITNPDMRDALRLLASWYRDDLIDPEWITGENRGDYWAMSYSFANGIIGFSMPGMHYHIAPPDLGVSGRDVYLPFHRSQGANASYTWTTLPVGPRGRSGAPQWGVIEGWYAVYGRQVPDVDLETWWRIAELLMADPLFTDASRFGVPGVQWDYDASGAPQPLPGAPTEETHPERYANVGLGANGIDRISHLAWDSVTMRRLRSLPIFDFARKTASSGNGLPDLVWGDFPSKRLYFDTVVRLSRTAYTQYITGARDINSDADWDAFVKSVNDAGLLVMTREAQEWYDRHR
jgi:putative aldouronate transport system substrate-binding protein